MGCEEEAAQVRAFHERRGRKEEMALLRDQDVSVQDDIQAMMAETQDLLSHVNHFLDGHASELRAGAGAGPVRSTAQAVTSRSLVNLGGDQSRSLREKPCSDAAKTIGSGRMNDDDACQEQLLPNQLEDEFVTAMPNENTNYEDNEEKEFVLQPTRAMPPPAELTNQQVNTSKVGALKVVLLDGLVRLGFRESVCLDALEASAQDICDLETECELAYVDIFIALVKAVSNAHAGLDRPDVHTHAVLGEELQRIESIESVEVGDNQPSDVNGLEEFKWPVFDMAQFEFGSARSDTCFDAVCVLVNLPKVSIERTEELMEVLSCHLFGMLADPVQVVISSVGVTGRTKGHAFVEFDDPIIARLCSRAIDGLVWGRGDGGRVRARLFRDYHVTSHAVASYPAEAYSVPEVEQQHIETEDNNQYFVDNVSVSDSYVSNEAQSIASIGVENDDDGWTTDGSLDSELLDADATASTPFLGATETKNRPWRAYCEELIARNHQIQQQSAFLRRRVVQLGHHNQKLHLLVDRLERDRDGLLFENDLLQAQMSGYEENERRQEIVLNDMLTLRKRLDKKERKCAQQKRMLEQHVRGFRQGHHMPLEGLRDMLQLHFNPLVLGARSFDDLKEWEQMLESTLAQVRAVKEEKAIEMQKLLDRRAEEQIETKLCVICLSSEKTILCLPCRHLCLCEECSNRDEVEKCPICRVEIVEMLLVYA
ncbi:TPA: hypothetical protein N0F65_012965 [Lagenidium giganteum]|uniref:RING-type domain-containing protein n=1 Tax=Lagenidium giganteum TaxID=4803 RepID=A0AAV2Z4Z0_9STRA|nr:TPA: hypothetical protein N0F65_012965 [Lagenidium giganteum]